MIIKGMCTLCNFFCFKLCDNICANISVYESVTNNQNYMLIRELYFLRSDSIFDGMLECKITFLLHTTLA